MHEKRRIPTSGIVLAAGMSTRFGHGNKLLATVDGIPIVRRTVLAYVGAALESVVVVVGYDRFAVRDALAGIDVHVIFNERFRDGQSTSLRCGLDALSAECLGAVIGVGDQPYLTATVVRELVDRFTRSDGPMVAPLYGQHRGNPVVFHRSLFPELREVSGDVGGRPVLQAHRGDVEWVQFEDARLGADVDQPDDLNAL